MNNLVRYFPQNNIEIKNIPETIKQSNRETYVLKVMESTGVKR